MKNSQIVMTESEAMELYSDLMDSEDKKQHLETISTLAQLLNITPEQKNF